MQIQDFLLILYFFLTFQETLQVSLQPEEGTEKPGNEKAPSGPPPKEPPSAQNKMMNTARQFSKGSLGLGDSKMASTVMSAMGKKAQKSDAAPAAGAPPPNSKPAPNKSGPPGPPGPTKPATEPSELVKPMVKPVRLIKKEEDVDPKPGPSRKRHDSQGKEFRLSPHKVAKKCHYWPLLGAKFFHLSCKCLIFIHVSHHHHFFLLFLL